MNVPLTTWPRPRFATQRMEKLRAEAADAEGDPFLALLAHVKLLGSAGQITKAQEMLRDGEHHFPAEAIRAEMFRHLLPAAILIGGAGLAKAWLSKRFQSDYTTDFEITQSDTPFDVVHLIVQAKTAIFVIQASLFHSPGVESTLTRLIDVFPIFHMFMISRYRVDGHVDINLGDYGLRPGLAFCGYRPGNFLIPDATYMDMGRYKPIRNCFRSRDVPWADRRQIGFWRGTTSGRPMDQTAGWRSLPRIRLCEISAEHPNLLDAGITGVTQIDDPTANEWLTSRNMLRGHVPPETFQRHRYQVDIDGNSNSWPGLFIKLLTGSPVLKIDSAEGYQQWYYDRLRPWINYVPVDKAMGDLAEKLKWLRTHDDTARAIGEAGRGLAEELTDEQEVVRAAPVFAAAIRAAAPGPEIDLRFGWDMSGDDVLRTGWLAPEADGVNASGFESRMEIAKPYGLGDFILIVELSPAASRATRVAIIANGEVILQRSLQKRTTFYCPLPHRVACASATLNLGFCLPDSETNSGPDNPLDARMLSVKLHRIAIAATHCYTGNEHPDLSTALATLRSGGLEGSSAHNLWGPVRSIPSQAPPLTIRTCHDTIIYADLGSGRLRHAPPAEVPRNLVLLCGRHRASSSTPDDIPRLVVSQAKLRRVNSDGVLFGVELRPEGPHVAQVDPGSITPEGMVCTFKVTFTEFATPLTLAIRGAGLYLCAELGGDVSLSRVAAGHWEHFSFEPVGV
jgi:hypothetical protein